MKMMEQINKLKTYSWIDVATYKAILKTEEYLRVAFGKHFDAMKQVRLSLMTVRAKLSGKSFSNCCIDHLDVIAKREGRQDKKDNDRLFILIIMQENHLYSKLSA